MSELHMRDALRSVADADPDPDVDQGWDEVQRRIAGGDRRTARPGRWAVGALAAAAAIVVAVLGYRTAGEEDSVRLDTAGDPATTVPEVSVPDGFAPDEQEGVPVILPSDPVAVLGPKGAMVHVMDPATGERSTTIQDPGGRRATAAVATPAGDVYVLLRGDEPVLARGRWDAGDLEHLVGWPGASAASLAVDRAGRLAAIGLLGSDGRASLALVDLEANSVRQLLWPDGGDRRSHRPPRELSFSPDGSQIAFLDVHDTGGTDGADALAVEIRAGDLGAARPISGDGSRGAWDRVSDLTYAPQGLGGIVAVTRLGQGDPQVRFIEGGPDVGLPPLHGVTAVEASGDHLLARTEDAWYALDPGADAWRPVGFEDWTG